MKFKYNISDLSSNTCAKFYQNPTDSNRDISHKSGTDKQTDRLPDCDNKMWSDTGDSLITQGLIPEVLLLDHQLFYVLFTRID